MLWPTLTTGGIYLVIIEGLWLKPAIGTITIMLAFLAALPSTSVLVWQRAFQWNFSLAPTAPSRKQLATFLAVSLGLRHPGRLCWKQHSGHHVVWLGARQPNHYHLYNSSCDWGKLIHALDFDGKFLDANLRVEMMSRENL